MKKRSAVLGKFVYFFSKPAITLILANSNRSYALIRHENEVLVVKNWLGMHDKWHLPGGGFLANEEPLQGLIRELGEELGISLPPNSFRLLQNQAFKSKGQYRYWIFEAKLAKKPTLNINNHEIFDYKWIEETKLVNLPKTNPLETALLNFKF